jgi:acetyl-CoA acetyltransferase
MAMATDTEASFKGSMMDMVGFEMTKLAAQKAYRQAGVTPHDIQVIELHDCFSANEVRKKKEGKKQIMCHICYGSRIDLCVWRRCS